MKWTDEHYKVVNTLISQKVTYVEIGRQIGRSAASIANYCKRTGIKSIKLKHHEINRNELYDYYKTHTYSETCDYYNVTAKELKSILTYHCHYSNERKDNRYRHRAMWTIDELKQTIGLIGIIKRSSIAILIDRSNYRTVKEKLRELGINYQLTQLIYHEALMIGYKGEALERPPLAKSGHFTKLGKYFVPYVMLASQTYDEPLNSCIQASAKFQRWALDAKTNAEAITKIKEILEWEKTS